MNAKLKRLVANLNEIATELELAAEVATEFNTPKNKYLTIEQAAEFLGLTKPALYTMTSRKQIAYYKPSGKNIYFLEADLLAWIESKRVKTASEIESDAAALCVK